MSDIVQRLRFMREHGGRDYSCMDEAADRIEELEKHEKARHETWLDAKVLDLESDNATLRAALKTHAEEAAKLLEANRELLEALKESRQTLERENAWPGGWPIVDTIWHTDHETLFDFMGAVINKHTTTKETK